MVERIMVVFSLQNRVPSLSLVNALFFFCFILPFLAPSYPLELLVQNESVVTQKSTFPSTSQFRFLVWFSPSSFCFLLFFYFSPHSLLPFRQVGLSSKFQDEGPITFLGGIILFIDLLRSILIIHHYCALCITCSCWLFWHMFSSIIGRQ